MQTRAGDAYAFYCKMVVESDIDACILWPYAKNAGGRGVIRRFGQTRLVHRLACIEVHGQPPTLEHEAAHSCGNGHLGCVNPNHIQWETRRQNAADMVAHGRSTRGEKNPAAKLTADDVQAIRTLEGSMPQREIASLFGIAQQNVSDICRGKRWTWLGEAA